MILGLKLNQLLWIFVADTMLINSEQNLKSA